VRKNIVSQHVRISGRMGVRKVSNSQTDLQDQLKVIYIGAIR